MGANALFAWGAPAPGNHFSLKRINGKSPLDIIGEYHGYAFGAGLVYGSAVFSQVWLRDVSLLEQDLGMGLGAAVTYQAKKIRAKKSISIHECENNLYILHDTTSRRSPEACLEMAISAGADSDFSGYKEKIIPFDMSQMRGLTFTKVPVD